MMDRPRTRSGSAGIRARLLQDLRALERECDWDAVISVGQTLQALYGSTEEIVSTVAQALLMNGRKQQALLRQSAIVP